MPQQAEWLQSAVMLRSASQINLVAASSLGKWPRVVEEVGPSCLPEVMFRTSPFIAELEQHTLRCVLLRASDGMLLPASGCTTRRADGVPAFLS
jgi:hypothetical protein